MVNQSVLKPQKSFKKILASKVHRLSRGSDGGVVCLCVWCACARACVCVCVCVCACVHACLSAHACFSVHECASVHMHLYLHHMDVFFI